MGIKSTFYRCSEICAVQRVGVLLRAEKKTLGRHAAFIQARSAELLLLDQRRCKTGLRRAFRRQIAARAAAQYNHIKMFHRSFPFSSQDACVVMCAVEVHPPLSNKHMRI